MKNIIISLCIILALSCKNNTSKTENAITSIIPEVPKLEYYITPINNPELVKAPYKLNLEIEKVDKDVYDLKIGMELFDGAYYVSPNSKGNFKGIFTVFINDENNLKRVSKLIETPLSVEEFDPHPFVNGNVNWVRRNTTYNQKLKRTSNENFEVFGHIQFTIEPKCTLEKIPFIIINENGNMKIEIDNC